MGAYAFVKRKIAKFNTFFVLDICMIVTMPMPNGYGGFSRPVQNRHAKTATSTPKYFIFLTTGIVLHVRTLRGIKNPHLQKCIMYKKQHETSHSGS
ncbi:hypothetical protein [Succinimonas sp.]|uniref:hypothetical protein n=1 Tax=Succinimonas sp. TaxID=1936151 RepID=UPI00386F4DA2